MIEDGHAALADADDLERLAAAQPEQAEGCLRRRRALLEGVAGTFRLPAAPGEPACNGSDAVLVAVASLAKGRRLLAGLLGRLAAGAAAEPRGALAAAAARIAAALLRTARLVFAAPRGAPGAGGWERGEDSSFLELAAAAEAALALAAPPALAAALAALASGPAALPEAVDEATPHGRGGAAMLSALLRAGARAGLATGPGAESEAWRRSFNAFFGLLSARIAPAMGAALAAAPAGRAAAARAVPLLLLRDCRAHADAATQTNLATLMERLGV